jgi:hypothetical protein
MSDVSLADLIAMMTRAKAAILEEGTWAHRADDICVVIRPDNTVRLRLLKHTEPNVDPVFAKAMDLDPAWRTAS